MVDIALHSSPASDMPPAQSNGYRMLAIEGGTRLNGYVDIGGAKNAALPIIAATLLTADECVLQNVPDLSDVHTMCDLLASLGAKVEFDTRSKRLRIQANAITTTSAPPELVAKMRASFLVAGPLLTRFNETHASTPGGCKLGARPVDVDVRGFKKMGAEVEADDQQITARTTGLRGARIYMDYPSHTGTENLLMAASLASGRTTIVNAACEPEIVALGEMLNRMGANISGLGSPTITIEGVDRLHGVSATILPDRLEAGCYAIGAVITGGEVRLRGVRERDMLPLTEKLLEAGAQVWHQDTDMLIRAGDALSAVEVQTLPFPGFPTDLQAPFAVLMTQANGLSRIHERVFEDRLRYTDELVKMGADITVERYSRAVIQGPTKLTGTAVRALDIRAGAGMVLAGLVANGQTTVSDVYHLDRGYEGLVTKLRQIGAQINEIALPDPTAVEPTVRS
ncbi:MAG TPA: UDP-N-acetylglucosamine 1-carboxyvinyltransferase [Thermomicrobiales bacterium]|nr:UDP-N-acetylglucosamine 1-carboxyvinyltransferase [Thermomicrobiales bacterium]HRA48168.1 UDP-N-acetylglucosamine 1-carboxyvinyltransferase [Thermomicrobiales bacterium]